jgi:DNA replicative helicase MCM subunit Mcm2 (Cdc46/Mcm family)
MFAPQVIGHDDVKRGLLRSAVGGVESENQRGRIHTLTAGPPGEAKTMLVKEIVKIVPNSKGISGTHASGKSLVGIIDSENDVKTHRLGPVPLAKGAVCFINEIGTLPYDQQNYLLDLMEEGVTTITKDGLHFPIKANTTIVATTNPMGGSWKDQDNASFSEMPLLNTILDRCVQIHTFKTDNDEATNKQYAELKRYSRMIVPDYAFLIKYIQYAKSITEISIPSEVFIVLNNAWFEMVRNGIAGKRTLDGLYRMAQAQARLHISDTVTLEIAEEVIDDVRQMLKDRNAFMQVLADPKDLAISEIVKVVKDLKGEPILFQEAAKAACQNNEQVRTYLGDDFSASGSMKYRRLRDSVLENLPEGLVIRNKSPLSLSSSDMNDTNDMFGQRQITN